MLRYNEVAKMEIERFRKVTEDFKDKMDFIARHTFYIKSNTNDFCDLCNDYCQYNFAYDSKSIIMNMKIIMKMKKQYVLWDNVDKALQDLDIPEKNTIYSEIHNSMHCMDHLIYIEPLNENYYSLCIMEDCEGFGNTTKHPIARDNLITLLRELKLLQYTT